MSVLLKTLRRSPLLPVLIVIQVAIAFTICVNTTYVLWKQAAPVLRQDGVQSPDSLYLVTNLIPRGKPWPASRLREAQARLAEMPGVSATSLSTSFPFQVGVQVSAEVERQAGTPRHMTTIYVGNALVSTLGLTLSQGRDFTPEESDLALAGVGFGQSGAVIISRELSDRLFPDGNAIGATLDVVDAPGARTVVGVVENMMSNDLSPSSTSTLGNAMIFPGIAGRWQRMSFAFRTTNAGDASSTCARALAVLNQTFRGELAHGLEPKCSRFTDMRADALSGHRAAIWLLSGITFTVLLVALMGVGGLTAYWVQSRTRYIGIRRALGATRGDIVRLVLSENAVVVATGVAFGIVVTLSGSQWISEHLGLERTPLAYLCATALIVLLICQMAALKPARSASGVPPIAALGSAE